ncbi:MAG TPA: AEC family transporter [Desulfofustis sp.]|jgi:malonate transporter|nr:AEC family transporter [Desulfofustis sp. PB-SRB1]HBH29580.1 AEC family transporter [Desulfofustis sp.]
MQALFEVILPVFLVIGCGYGAVWRGLMTDEAIDALMRFAINFAIPCLLFSAISTLDLSQDFNIPLLATYYSGAAAGFLAGLLGGRFLFGRGWEDAVVFGFCGLFSNTVLLGLPIMERAYGADSLAANYAIIAIHAPFCYGVGVTAMEIIRADGTSVLHTAGNVLKAMFRNVLVIGVGLGFIVNISSITQPAVLTDALALITRAALPVALFGLGGVLVRYRPGGDVRAICYVAALSLVFHPAVVWGVGSATGLEINDFRAAVVTAAMAPGINCYIFASMYGAAQKVAASAVLLGTAASILTVWGWLAALGP